MIKYLEIHMEIVSTCILSCKHCSSHSIIEDKTYSEPLNLSEIKNLIVALKDTYKIRLILTGGEPLLIEKNFLLESLKDIKEIDKNIEIGLFSSGLLLCDNKLNYVSKEYSKLLKLYGLDFCYISFYDKQEKVHDMITGAIGSQRKSIDSIVNFSEAGINVNINLVVMEPNYRNINETIDFVRELGVKEVRLLKLIKHGSAIENWNEIGIDEKKQKDIILKIFNKYPQRFISVGGFLDICSCQQISNNKMCYAGIKKLYIDIRGNIFPCGCVKNNKKMSVGNINNVKEIDLTRKIASKNCLSIKNNTNNIY